MAHRKAGPRIEWEYGIRIDSRATSDGKTVGRNGTSSHDSGTIDPYADFTNFHMLDRYGKRIDRGN